MNKIKSTFKVSQIDKNIFTLMLSDKAADYFFINPVNTRGVMGKGLAKEFKKNNPNHFANYKRACLENKISVGKVFIDLDNKIIAFPTKDHWRGKSKISYIEEGLKDLHKKLKAKNIKKIIMPKIGTGLGGLDYKNVVLPMIKKEFDNSEMEKVVISTWSMKKQKLQMK